MENYIKLKGKSLIRAKRIEINLKNNIKDYQNGNESEKEVIAMGIYNDIWLILPPNKAKLSGYMTLKFKKDFLKNPSTKISYNHSEPRLKLSRRLFDNYEKYNWKFDGLTIEKIINDIRLDVYTQVENKANYKGDITLVPLTVPIEKIRLYQRYYNKGWIHHNNEFQLFDEFEMINLIPLHRSFRNEDDLFESTWGRNEIAESNEFHDLNDDERKNFLINIKD